jgi:hypothetical protein
MHHAKDNGVSFHWSKMDAVAMARIESADKIYEHEESGAMTSAAIGRRTRFQIRHRASAPHWSLDGFFYQRSRPLSVDRAVKNH